MSHFLTEGMNSYICTICTKHMYSYSTSLYLCFIVTYILLYIWYRWMYICFVFIYFFQAKWISEVNLKSGTEDKTAAGHDPQIPQVYYCFFFYQYEKTWLYSVLIFIYCWAARCLSVTEGFYFIKSMQPLCCTIQILSSMQAFVTLVLFLNKLLFGLFPHLWLFFIMDPWTL